MDDDRQSVWNSADEVTCSSGHERGARTSPNPQEHILIAGTGRAGTSFLVRYLTAIGLDTHLTRYGDTSWAPDANAGLEDMPEAGSTPGSQPYVMKSPWLAQEIDRVLADPAIRLRALLVPVRDLAEATSSRVILELQAMHRQHHRFATLDHTWRESASTPGGVVYSLEPLDLARLLALDFYTLVQRAVSADVPVVLLDFPRMASDWAYLHGMLLPVLPCPVSASHARQAHAAVADRSKLRVGRELEDDGTGDDGPRAASPGTLGLPEFRQLDRIAIGRELALVRDELAAKRAALSSANQEVAALTDASARDAATVRRLELEQGDAARVAREMMTLLDRERSDAARATAEAAARIEAALAEAARVAADEQRVREALRVAEARLAMVHASRSWRLTRPLRALVMVSRRLRNVSRRRRSQGPR